MIRNEAGPTHISVVLENESVPASGGGLAMTVGIPPNAGSPPTRESTWEELGLAPWVEPIYRRLRPHVPSALFVLGIYLVARTVLLVGDLLAAHLSYGGNLDGPLQAWDGHWYLQVAQAFYPPHVSTVHGHIVFTAGGFEPFFPSLIRVLISLGLTPVQSGLLVSLTAGAVATLLVWMLGSSLVSDRVGRISAVFFAFFPGMGVAWGVLYSECVGLALVAACLLLMVRERWLWAGLVGALATATNPMALALIPAAMVPVARALWKRERPGALITLLLTPVGFLGLAAYLGTRYHDALFWWHAQSQAWGGGIDFGKSLLILLWHPMSGGYQGKGWMQWLGVLAVAGAVLALIRAKLPLLINAYCAAVFVELLASNQGFKPRLLTWGFPALIAVATATQRRAWQPIALLFAGLLPYVFLAYVLYGNYMVQP
jgi:hypothetical protein